MDPGHLVDRHVLLVEAQSLDLELGLATKQVVVELVGLRQTGAIDRQGATQEVARVGLSPLMRPSDRLRSLGGPFTQRDPGQGGGVVVGRPRGRHPARGLAPDGDRREKIRKVDPIATGGGVGEFLSPSVEQGHGALGLSSLEFDEPGRHLDRPP